MKDSTHVWDMYRLYILYVKRNVFLIIYIYITDTIHVSYMSWIFPNGCNSVIKSISFYVGQALFWVLSFVQKIVLFGSLRVKVRGLDHAVWRSPSCKKLCFLVLSRAKNRGLDRAFRCSPSCKKTWFRSWLLLQLLGKIQHTCMLSTFPRLIGAHPLHLWGLTVPKAQDRARSWDGAKGTEIKRKRWKSQCGGFHWRTPKWMVKKKYY